MSATFDLAKPNRTIQVGVIMLKGTTEILDLAPIDFLNGMNKNFVEYWPEEALAKKYKDQALPIEFHWVTEKGEPAQLTSGARLLATDSFETCPKLDIVLIGAHLIGYNPDEAELAFVRKSWEDCTAFLTICGGVEVPLRAGLLQGLSATGPRPLLHMLRQQAPETEWVDARWHRDGKFWSSGALLNGLDLMLAFTETVWGGEGRLMTYLGRVGGLPRRDLHYKDDTWTL